MFKKDPTNRKNICASKQKYKNQENFKWRSVNFHLFIEVSSSGEVNRETYQKSTIYIGYKICMPTVTLLL